MDNNDQYNRSIYMSSTLKEYSHETKGIGFDDSTALLHIRILKVKGASACWSSEVN
jgi:hypothetical protein